MSDKFAYAAQQRAVRKLERDLVEVSRAYEDAAENNDLETATWAMESFNETQLKLKELKGENEPQQQGLLDSEKDFIARRIAQGDELTPARWRDFEIGAARALQAGWERGSPQYLKAIAGHIDSLGDGRQPPLDERQVARMCGLSDEEYAAGQHEIRARKRAGYYQE
jgi:hypothetical protein